MRRLTTLLLSLAAALTLVAPVTPADAASVPLPENDPFFTMPSNVARYAPGAVIRSRRVSIRASVPLPVTSWQIKYRTADAHGGPTATVTTLIVPKTAWKGSGSRPLVSYQPAEDGVSTRCAPSYGLRVGVLGAWSNAGGDEAALMMQALLNGWAVSVPDYEGRSSEFFAGRLEGKQVLDGVRASQQFAPAGLRARTPVGLWGYSGGAFATSIAAQLQPSYAPRINLRAIALGGTLGEIFPVIEDFSGSFAGGAIPMGVNGLMRAFPEAHIPSYLSTTGRRMVAASAHDCVFDGALRYPFLKISAIEAYPGAIRAPAIQKLLHVNSPLGIAGRPSAPVYDYHATFDELAPVSEDRRLMRRYCTAGVKVEHVEHPLAEHITEMITGVLGPVAFLKARFAGKAPKNTCASIPAP